MNIGSTNVAPGLVCAPTHQFFCFCTIANVPIWLYHELFFAQIISFHICFSFYTFWRWWRLRQWPYNQWLNVQHSTLCSL
jgi:hypothetical protein